MATRPVPEPEYSYFPLECPSQRTDDSPLDAALPLRARATPARRFSAADGWAAYLPETVRYRPDTLLIAA